MHNKSDANSFNWRLRNKMWWLPSWANPLKWCCPTPTSTIASAKTGRLASQGNPADCRQPSSATAPAITAARNRYARAR